MNNLQQCERFSHRTLRSIIIIASIFLSFESLSQKKIKYGQVSKQEIEMSSYELDSSAAAVVLYDKGHFRASDAKFFRHKRIKVLKKSGTSQGNITLYSPSRGSFKAVVFNTENGEIIEEKLDRSSVYEEEIYDGQFSYKLFLPNVKVGSVIDLYYSHYGIPYEWRFQDLIPTVHSELIVEKSNYLDFQKTQKGFEEVKQVKDNKWVAENIPAFSMEPYLSHYSNYITKFEFQIVRFTIPGRFTRDYSTSWELIGKRLLRNDYFGGLFKQSAFLNEKAKELEASDLSVEEKVTEAYKYVKEKIKWNNVENLYLSYDYRINFKSNHSGNSAEVNLILLSLLKKLDLNAYPVIMSTRNNGLLNPYIPSEWRLNYVMVYVEHDGYNVLHDATIPELVPGVVPEKCLNGQGWVILSEEHGKWIDLNPKKISARKQFININLNSEEGYSATISQSSTNYKYLDWHEEFKESGTESDYARLLEERYDELMIEDYKVEKNDPSSLMVQETIQVDLDDAIDDIGNELILNPYLMVELDENPFKSASRSYPIYLDHLEKQNGIINVFLSEDYIVNEIPQSISITMPDGGANFLFRCTSSGSKVQIQYRLEFKRQVFSEADYPVLKQFYSQMINKLNESIQITKRT